MADLGAGKVAFDLVTPTALVLSERVDMVVIPGSEGDIGVLPGHTPLITTLRPGLVDVHNDGAIVQSLFVFGGFAEATPERCTVLAESVEPLDKLSMQDAQARLAQAKETLAAAAEHEKSVSEDAVRAAEALILALGMRKGAA